MGVIEAAGVWVRYPTRRAPALDGVDASIGAGERVLLAGPSGSGKSTFALCLNGLIPHSLAAEVRGRLLVAGQETWTARPEHLAQTVGLLFQDPTSQFTMLTVEDEVAFGLENLGVPRAAMEARIVAALTAVGLMAYRRRRLDRLSGGQQQRVALATLLAMEPAVLVLDEPTAHLDPLTARQLHGLLADLAAAGRTLVVIEHNLEPLLPALGRVLALDGRGQVLADGPARAVLAGQAAELAAAGIWLPAAVRLDQALAARGAPLGGTPLTLTEGAAALAASPAAASLLRDSADRQAQPPPTPPAAAWSAGPSRRAPVALRAHGLGWAYPGGPPVLRAVAASVPAGGFTAIVGENGAGKTTLALLLAGLLPPPAGQVTVDGRDLAGLTPAEMAALVGFVFQNPEHQFVADTVRDEVAYGPRARRWPAAVVDEVVAGLLAEFGLAPLAAANPFSLSRGQQRRLSVAAMLAAAPAALLLDEPTFGQDAAQAARLLARLERLRREGTTIGVVTHDLELVAEYATHVIALRAGQVVYEGAPAGLLADAALLASIGQVVPPLPDLLTQARALGAAVPAYLRWRDIVADGPGARPDGVLTPPSVWESE